MLDSQWPKILRIIILLYNDFLGFSDIPIAHMTFKLSLGLATAASQALLLVLNLSELFCHGFCVNKEKKIIHNILKHLGGLKVQ